MSVSEVREFLDRGARAGEPAGVAVLVRAWRSAPRRPGARFAAAASGVAGSISAGCVEADLREHLAAVSAGAPPRLLRYGIADADAAAIGLSCGGEIEVLARAHRPEDPAWRALLAAIDAEEEAALVTGLSEPIRGQSVLVDRETVAGSLGSPDLDDRAREAGLAALSGDGSARVVELTSTGSARVPTEEPLEALVEAFLRPRALVVVGAGRLAEALAALARPLEVPCTVVEPRPTLAAESRAAGVRVLEAEPAEALARLGAGPRSAVAVVAHDERLDVPALVAALHAGCGYVGLLGGRRTRQARLGALRSEGIDEGRLAAIRAPIGLDIGAESPAEIALAILADVIATWRGRGGPPGT
jgi:xanthine dehydrogenase accessory factor